MAVYIFVVLLWAYFDDLGVDVVVFWGAESISEGVKLIGCQGHVILAKVMMIVFNSASFSWSYMD